MKKVMLYGCGIWRLTESNKSIRSYGNEDYSVIYEYFTMKDQE